MLKGGWVACTTLDSPLTVRVEAGASTHHAVAAPHAHTAQTAHTTHTTHTHAAAPEAAGTGTTSPAAAAAWGARGVHLHTGEPVDVRVCGVRECGKYVECVEYVSA